MRIDDVTGVVLAGGVGERMGGDKAFLTLAGKSLVFTVAEKLREVFSEVMVVTKRPEWTRKIGLRAVMDVLPVRGALIGIYSSLLASSTSYNFIVACDMPFINPDLVKWMVSNADGYDVFLPKIGSFIEPLFGLYSKECVSPIGKQIELGDLRIRGFFPYVRTGFASEESIRAIDPDLKSFTNVNTRDDLERARRSLA